MNADSKIVGAHPAICVGPSRLNASRLPAPVECLLTPQSSERHFEDRILSPMELEMQAGLA